MRNKLVGAALLSMTFALAIPGPATAGAWCQGDPCADTDCDGTYASAMANGSEYSHSVATAGGDTKQDVKGNGGDTSATVFGGAPTEADAKAKKDWSLKEKTAYCSFREGSHVLALLLTLLDDDPVEFPEARLMSIGCVADDRIRVTESFLGRLYLGQDGDLVLFDPVRGDGLALDGLALKFDGASLDAAAPMDITGMAPTSLAVALDFVDEARTSSCSSVLYV